jgi:hypothetical protein
MWSTSSSRSGNATGVERDDSELDLILDSFELRLTIHAHAAPPIRQTNVAAPSGGLPSRLGRTRCSADPQGNPSTERLGIEGHWPRECGGATVGKAIRLVNPWCSP